MYGSSKSYLKYDANGRNFVMQGQSECLQWIYFIPKYRLQLATAAKGQNSLNIFLDVIIASSRDHVILALGKDSYSSNTYMNLYYHISAVLVCQNGRVVDNHWHIMEKSQTEHALSVASLLTV